MEQWNMPHGKNEYLSLLENKGVITMSKLESIKERNVGNAYKPYFMDVFGENKESFSTHDDVSYLLQRLERYETALKEANTIIHDYKEVRGYREHQVLEIADIIKEALKE